MSAHAPTALIADDEPLLREALRTQLSRLWPALSVVAEARNGREAVALHASHRPDICFLDVHMPGWSGIDAARQIGAAAHLVFVTAYDQYAIEAFAQGVLDYLVKPVDDARLTETVRRLQQRLRETSARPDLDALLASLARQLGQSEKAAPLRWLRASVGQTLRLIAVEDVDYLRADQKYTRVAWRGEGGVAGEALIRTPLKELKDQLDPEHFLQVHRAVIVNLRAISHITRGDHDSAEIHLKQRKESLPVSRNFLHLFRQM